MGTLYVCCSCDEHYGGDALACAKSIAAGTTTPCGCDCHKAGPPPGEETRLALQQALAELKQARESVAWWQGVAEAKQEERDRCRKEIVAVHAAIQAGNLIVYAKPAPGSDDATVTLAECVAGAAAEIKRRHQLYLDEFRRGTKLVESVTKIGEQCERLIDENDRLRSALLLISQVRAVNGSAQGAFRCNLRTADAALAGADLRDVDTVMAVADGTWKPKGLT